MIPVSNSVIRSAGEKMVSMYRAWIQLVKPMQDPTLSVNRFVRIRGS